MAVAAGVDESDLGVDALDEGVGDAQFNGGDNFLEVDLEPLSQGDEGVGAFPRRVGAPARDSLGPDPTMAGTLISKLASPPSSYRSFPTL